VDVDSRSLRLVAPHRQPPSPRPIADMVRFHPVRDPVLARRFAQPVRHLRQSSVGQFPADSTLRGRVEIHLQVELLPEVAYHRRHARVPGSGGGNIERSYVRDCFFVD